MTIGRREFLQQSALASSVLMAGHSELSASKKKATRLRDVGWAWEGQGLDPHVPPSIYGLGQGTTYLGLQRANFLFHPTDEYALGLLANLKEITCDITKWETFWDKDGHLRFDCFGGAERKMDEAKRISLLSKTFPNITGVFFDDLKGRMGHDKVSPEQIAEIFAAAHTCNPNLKRWAVVYTGELGEVALWKSLAPSIDVVNLWIWHSKDIETQESEVNRAREIFPDHEFIMGCYLRDYTMVAPIPVEQVMLQMNGVLRMLEKDLIQGFSILGSVLIDSHRPQADAVRDFIAANS
ncbi:MAG TPA: hypothetical protein PLQ35_13430 [bacterium]|nr:hypothetical protein [bacterium]HQL63287.1 hypothetical protein [bacterium]